MDTIQTPREPCAERAIVALATTNGATAEAVDTAIIAFPTRTIRRERPVKLIQHPSFRRAADLGPDPRFTLAGRAPHLLAELAEAA